MSIFHLEKMTWDEVNRLDRQKSIFFFSISPVEEHGPHLPLGTDFFGAEDMLGLALEKLERREPSLNYVRVPGIPAGCTETAMEFPGTLTLRGKTLAALVTDICSSIARHGFRYIIISNHHLDMVHVKAIYKGMQKTMKKHDIRIYEPTSSNLYSDNPPKPGIDPGLDLRKEVHADFRETSYIAYKYPELLRDNYKTLQPVYINIAKLARKGVKTFKKMGAEKGYIGTPSKADAEFGKYHIEDGASIIANSALGLMRGEELPEISRNMKFVMKYFVKLK